MQRLAQPVGEQQAVGQAGQPVVQGLVRQRLLRLVHRGDVDVHDHGAGAVVEVERRDADAVPALLLRAVAGVVAHVPGEGAVEHGLQPLADVARDGRLGGLGRVAAGLQVVAAGAGQLGCAAVVEREPPPGGVDRDDDAGAVDGAGRCLQAVEQAAGEALVVPGLALGLAALHGVAHGGRQPLPVVLALDQVVLRAGGERGQRQLAVVPAGEHEQRRPGAVGEHRVDDREALGVRQRQVGQHDVVRPGQLRVRLGQGAADLHLGVAELVLEHGHDQAAVGGGVLDEQHPQRRCGRGGRHGRRPEGSRTRPSQKSSIDRTTCTNCATSTGLVR